MKIKVKHIIILLAAMAVLHIFATQTGMYETRIIWIDKLLHVMAGIAISMVWFIIVEKYDGAGQGKLTQFMALVGFVLLLALIWEIAEAMFLAFLPAYAKTMELYSPHIKDVLTDMFANLIGAILFGWVALHKKFKNTKFSK